MNMLAWTILCCGKKIRAAFKAKRSLKEVELSGEIFEAGGQGALVLVGQGIN